MTVSNRVLRWRLALVIISERSLYGFARGVIEAANPVSIIDMGN